MLLVSDSYHRTREFAMMFLARWGIETVVIGQDQFAFENFSVLDTVIMGHERLYNIIKEKDAIYAKPDFSDADGIRTAELEHEFADMSGWDAEPEAAKLLSDLGIPDAMHQVPMKQLEASEKVRVLLAQALFGNPDVLLLDDGKIELRVESSAGTEVRLQVVTGGMPGWERTIDKYGITYFVLKSMDSSGMILPIVPILANDPHLLIEFPSVWYEMHLVSVDLDVAGVSIPGVPFIALGHNARIAWGMTNTGADVQDLYLERIDVGRKQALWHGEWVPVEVTTANIPVRGRRAPQPFEIWKTRHGPIFANVGLDWEVPPAWLSPVGRVAGLDVNMAYAENLERLILPSAARVVEAVG